MGGLAHHMLNGGDGGGLCLPSRPTTQATRPVKDSRSLFFALATATWLKVSAPGTFKGLGPSARKGVRLGGSFNEAAGVRGRGEDKADAKRVVGKAGTPRKKP